jgi:hypothetical protein
MLARITTVQRCATLLRACSQRCQRRLLTTLHVFSANARVCDRARDLKHQLTRRSRETTGHV